MRRSEDYKVITIYQPLDTLAIIIHHKINYSQIIITTIKFEHKQSKNEFQVKLKKRQFYKQTGNRKTKLLIMNLIFKYKCKQ